MFEKLNKSKKLQKAKKLFVSAIDADTKWQREARDDFDFRDGKQWTDEEEQILREELRPVLTFNLTKSSVDLIMGINEDNKIVYRSTAVDSTDGFLADVLNDLYDNIQETQGFESELDGALESATICGRGWISIDFRPDPNRFGEVILSIVNVPVNEIHFDPAARRTALEDASYIVWDKWISREDFKIKYPNISDSAIKALSEESVSSFGTNSDPVSEDGIPISSPPSSDYDQPMLDDSTFYDRNKEMIRVIHMEYWSSYKRYYVYNPESGQFEEVPSAPTKEQKELFLQQFGEEMTIETMYDKRVHWLQFTGDRILYDDISPLPFPGFSLVPIFVYRDVSQRTMNHFGIVRLMKDPQREINKRWSQALNMLNQQVQPGVYAETDTFVDESQARQSMKVPGEVTWVNSGSLTAGKLKERTVPTFPSAPMQMEEFSQNIMKKITGINPDLLGQDRGRQEPGVVVRLRQQQGLTLLKPLFKNFNHMKKGVYMRVLSIIMQYMPDNQILRILGEGDRYEIQDGIIIDKEYQMQASIRDVRDLNYNITAEPAPGNMTQRMLELQALLEMSQTMPVPPEQIINKMDISETDKQMWLKYIAEQQQAQQEAEQSAAEAEQKMSEAELDLKNKELEQEFITDMAKIKQMAEKDEKNLRTKFAQLSQNQQQSYRDFIVQMASLLKDMDKEGKEKNGS